ncbi:histidine phosphatase family protein [Mesorhizobium sp. BAC0120]|uniref:histidine phosphatase family protein n=1 Tax=Mesorhizobium sp. BAC0120 TaxID=3090670 RepID=UPI00298BCA97|nr:histidine phosphatase family protein [Mesorhizobium sp. BAC0120]MDW6023584.1 histidine phosphatase family protein [Mesorhizobium sp. BAC0120]
MTTTFFLVRHAAHDEVETLLAGRMEGIQLGAMGRAQAARLAERMRSEQFGAVYSSPRARSRATAEAIAGVSGVSPVQTDQNLDEIDFGDWSGKTFAELENDPDWRLWNSDRSRASTPAGDTMLQVRERVTGCMERLRPVHVESGVVLVSHADVIKAAVCRILALPSDAGARFDISPASVTTIVLGEWGARIISLNEIVH